MQIPEFKLERYFARWEFVAPYLLSSSDVEGYHLNDLLELAGDEGRELWRNLSLGYTETTGHPLLRAQIADLYQGVTADEVLTFAGAEEAIFILMNVLLRPGDHAIVTWPGYQSLYTIAQASGVEVTLFPLEQSESWTLNIDKLRRAVKSNTRLIVVNFPHNPTGALADHTTFARIVQLAEEVGAYLFSDEVYRFMEYDATDRLPAAVEATARGISMGAMSKSFALAGLRIGWLATHDVDLLRRVVAFKDYVSICNSAPSEILALIALRAKAAVLERSLGIIEGNLAHLDRFFAEWSDVFAWKRPRAGSVGFPRLLIDTPIEQFASELVEQQGVMLLPGTVYDHPGNHFRIGFGRSNMLEALGRLEHFMQQRFR
jgi:aspartate/methionine/tyrosine aminotransferase